MDPKVPGARAPVLLRGVRRRPRPSTRARRASRSARLRRPARRVQPLASLGRGVEGRRPRDAPAQPESARERPVPARRVGGGADALARAQHAVRGAARRPPSRSSSGSCPRRRRRSPGSSRASSTRCASRSPRRRRSTRRPGPRARRGRSTFDELSYAYFGWNNRSPLFSDRRVRRALTMLVDRESIDRNLFGGLAKLANGPLPPAHWAWNASIAPWPYDPAQAEQAPRRGRLPRRGRTGSGARAA